MVELWIIVGLTGSFVVGLFNLYQKYLIEKGQTPITGRNGNAFSGFCTALINSVVHSGILFD